MKHAPSTGSAPNNPRPDLPHSSPRAPVHWFFPRPHVHEGIPFANAVVGALVWGEGRLLRVTLGRVDLWDHRGGMPWTAAQNFRDLRAALEAHDEARVRALFDAPAMRPAYRTAPSPCPSAPSNSTSAPVLFFGLTVTLDGREAVHSPEPDAPVHPAGRSMILVELPDEPLRSAGRSAARRPVPMMDPTAPTERVPWETEDAWCRSHDSASRAWCSRGVCGRVS